MNEQRLEKHSKIILAKASEKKVSETEQETKERMKKNLNSRDSAMKKIYTYQEKTGIVSDDEMDKTFIGTEAKKDISLEEFRSKENDDEV